MVGRYIRKASLWFALTVIVAANILGLLPAVSTPKKAYAVGSPLFTYQARSYVGKRIDQNTINLQARFEVSEDGLIDESLGFLTAKLTLQLGSSNSEEDSWKVSSLNFTDTNFSSSNASAQGSTITIKGQRFEFNGNAYDFEYRKGLDPGIAGLLIQKGGSPVGPGDGSNNEHPVSAFQFAANEHNIGNTLVTLPVDNYGSPGSGDGATVYSKWLGNVNSVRIVIDEAGENTPPPYVNIGEDSRVERPKLKFVLSTTDIEGSVVVNGQKWLLFGANKLGGDGSLEAIPGLYFITSDDANNNYFLFTTASISETIASGLRCPQGGPYVLTPPCGIGVPDEDVIRVFNYIMDVPKDGTNNCLTGGVYMTGPGSADGETVPKIQAKYPATTRANASLLNFNCTDKSPTGWLAKWGVKIIDNSNGGCSLGGVVTGDVGQIITKIIACTVEALVKGILGPLTDGLQYVTGTTQKLEERLKDRDDGLYKAWQYSLGLINIVVILALLAIAFANILHLNINTYAAKKALPGLVIGVIGANASLLLIRFILDIVQALIQLSLEIAPAPHLSGLVARFIEILGSASFSNPILTTIALPFTLFIMIVFILYFVFLVVIFAWAMAKRLVFLYGLIILAPLAFVSYGIPSMQHWFGKWWSTFLQQAFVLPIVLFGIAMFIRYGQELGFGVQLGTKPTPSDIINGVLVFAAATFILKLPGLVTKGALDVTNAAKKAFGMATKAPATAYGYAQGGMGGLKKRYSAQSDAALSRGAELRRKANALQASGDIAGARQARKEALSHYKEGLSAKKKAGLAGKGRDFFGAARGRAYTIANPDKVIKPLWEARMKVGERASSIESSKVNVGKWNLSDVVSGRAGGYAAKSDDSRKRIREEAGSVEEALAMAKDSPAGDMIKEVEKYIKAKGMDEAAAMKFRIQIASAKKADKMDEILDEMAAAGFNIKGKGLYAESMLSGFYDFAIRDSKRRGTPNYKDQNDKFIQWGVAAPFGTGGAPFTGGPASPGSPSASTGGNGVTINANQVAVNAAQQVGSSDPDVISEATQIRDLAAFLKTPAQAVGTDGVAESQDEAREQKSALLAGLSAGWKDYTNLADEDRLKLREETRTVLEGVIADGDNVVRQGADRLLADDSQGSADGLAELTRQLAAATKPGHLESLEQQIAHMHTLSGNAAAANQAGAQLVAGGLDTEKMLQALNNQPGQFAEQIEQLISPHYEKMVGALGKQGNAAELKNISNAMVNELRNTISGRGPRSLPRLMQNWVANMGTSVAKHVSYAQSNQPEIKVNVEPGKPPVIAPPTAGSVTNITQTENNITKTEVVGGASSPISSTGSLNTGSIASAQRIRIEPPTSEPSIGEIPPPTEPPTPPSTP